MTENVLWLFKALVVSSSRLLILLTVTIGDDIVKIATHPTFQVALDDDVWLRFPADKIRWVNPDSGKVLYA